MWSLVVLVLEKSARAAMQFKGNKEFADLLWHLAADEKVHYHFMCKAAELVKGADYQVSEITGSDIVKNSGGKVKRISLEKGLKKTIDWYRKNDQKKY